MSAGGGADVLIGGAGSDLLFGGSNVGVDDKGNALKDVAVYDGTSTGDTATFTVAEAGFVICTGVVSATGECLVVTTENDAVAEMSDSLISASASPTIYTSVAEVYVAKVDSTYDQVVDGEQDGNPDVIQTFESDGTTGHGYYANIDGAAGVDIFEGSSDDKFDSDNMTLEKVLQVTESDGSKFLIYDAHEVIDVYTVTNTSTNDVDTVIGVEEFEFSDGTMELGIQVEQTVTFSIETGLTELNNMLGTAFSDEFTSDSSSEIFTGGAGADVITLGDGSGTDRITDFDISTDKLEIVQNVNDTAITGASSALSRITDTSDGALVNLGYSGTGSEQVQHTILLEGVSKDSLSSDNFLVPEIL